MNNGIFSGFGQPQQTAQADVPVGGLLGLVDQASPNPIINGAEYLKSSVLKPVSGYEALLTTAPYLGCILGTQGRSVGMTSVAGLAGTSNGNIYAINGSGTNNTRVAAGVSATFNDVPNTDHSVTDFCVMRTRLVLLRGTNQITSVLGASASILTVAQGQILCAANTAGTLCVLGSNNISTFSGGTVTSTDGVSFVNTVPSQTVSDCRIIMWCSVASTFLFVNSAGNLWSTPDGFTMTVQTALGVQGVQLPDRPANVWASSATSTIFLADITPTGGGAPFRAMCRTTNGTSFTVTPLATLLNLDGFQTPPSRIARVGSEWIMWGSHTQVGGVASVYRSIDDGVTWTKSPIWVDVNDPNRSNFFLGQGTGPVTTFIANSTGGNLISLASPTAATHVGMPIPVLANLSNVGTRHTPLYVRIK